jgi:hypothetical protein
MSDQLVPKAATHTTHKKGRKENGWEGGREGNGIGKCDYCRIKVNIQYLQNKYL